MDYMNKCDENWQTKKKYSEDISKIELKFYNDFATGE